MLQPQALIFIQWLKAIVRLALALVCLLLDSPPPGRRKVARTSVSVASLAAELSDHSVIINEIQYHPASDDHGEEYIELYNDGATAVDLSGWRFSDGIAYTFPAGISIPPGGYVVVGHDPATVESVYDTSGVLGPFASGRLSNGGERVALEDAGSTLVDEVTYDDHAPWPELPDGKGPSLELISPAFDNKRPCSWAASQPAETSLGTPGAQNSVYSSDNVPPCITDVAHTPVFPTSSQPVVVTALVDDNVAVAAVTLHYRPEETSDYTTQKMVDDGSGGDSVAGDSRYTALVPPQEDGRYVEFYVSATDDEGAGRTVPEGAPGITSDETGLPVTISILYQVEDTPPTSTLPLYRLIMTQENQEELTARDLFSNVLLDATFVYGGEVFHNVGVRYRGESSRYHLPHPYRVKFRDEHEFEDRERLNLVSDELGREAMAHDLFQRVGLLAPNTRFVTLYVNADKEGDYLDIEQVDNDFLEAHLPGNDNGNLYRGFDGADLGYRGPDPDHYRPYYLKENNEDADDYSDVIALTDALTNSPDEAFRAQSEAVADMRQWLRWFAVQAVLDNHEGALWIGQGDDYFLYHRPSDDRFVLISWDHDYTFAYPEHSIWEPDWLASDIVQRILHYPDFTRWYYQDIVSIAANEFSTAEIYPRIDALPDVVSEEDRNELKWYVAERIPELNSQMPDTTLSITTNDGADFTTTEPVVTLEGDCSPLRDVQVNGSVAGVQYSTATSWRYATTLWTRHNEFTISDGVDSHTITVHWDSFHGGTLTEDTTVSTNRYPYVITDDIVVPEGTTLTIEPGVVLQFQAERALRVEGGRLLAEGTASQPIVFTRQENDHWGGILLNQTRADNQITHAVVEYTHEVISDPQTHGVSAYDSQVTIADSIIRHAQGSGAVLADQSSTLYLLRNQIHDVEGDAVRATGGHAFIQGNHIYDIQHATLPPEGIEISLMGHTAVVRDNHLHHISDDCLDTNNASATIERNVIHHCGDKGVSIGHESSAILTNNLVYSSLTGIAVRDGSSAHIVNNTVAGNQGSGLWLYEKNEGEGGGQGTAINCIVWDNGTAVELDALSTIAVTYSDVEGGWDGEGNMDENPRFRTPQNGDYRLLEGSPCVDSGTAAGAPSEDIRGVARPHGAGHDRGAYEFFAFFSCHVPLTLGPQ